MTPVIYHPARLPDSSLGVFKNSFSSKMKKSETRGSSRGRQPRHLSSGCYCSRLGSVWVSPQFAKDESSVAQAQKTAKGKTWRKLSRTNPGSAHWRRIWGPVGVARLIWDCPQFELSDFVSWKSLRFLGGEEEQHFVKTVYFLVCL